MLILGIQLDHCSAFVGYGRQLRVGYGGNGVLWCSGAGFFFLGIPLELVGPAVWFCHFELVVRYGVEMYVGTDLGRQPVLILVHLSLNNGLLVAVALFLVDLGGRACLAV